MTRPRAPSRSASPGTGSGSAAPTPTISIIVPVFNVEDHVAAAIASLRAQTFADFEALVIDDGSTDDSAARAVAAIGDDPRFRLIQQDNQGLSGARNTGLDAARGDFIAFLDSDDRFRPDFLSRMHRALADSGADWVACAVRSCFADGGGQTHSAIHGAADLASHPVPRRYVFDSCLDVIPHFPSAWNKLYRRRLIEGLRFDAGTWFEDHGFFHRAAARTDHILHLPDALYLQTRDRVGQITASDDDRVFDQLDVLGHMHGWLQESGRAEADAAFARIATRLVFERSTQIADPDRRARFAAACAAFFDQQGIAYDPDWDGDIGRLWGQEMACAPDGPPILSVIVPWNGTGPETLAATVRSATDRHGPSHEVLVLCDSEKVAKAARTQLGTQPAVQVLVQPGPKGVAGARMHGLAQARGTYVIFLDAGDVLRPGAALAWAETMHKTGANLGTAQFYEGTGADAQAHNGFDDMRVLPGGTPATGALHLTGGDVLALALPLSAKIFRRQALLDTGLRFVPGRRGHWALVLGAAAMSDPIAYVAWAGVAIATDTPPRPETGRSLARSHDALCRTLPAATRADLPQGWQRRLFARALRHAVTWNRPATKARLLRLLAGAAWAALRRGLTGPQQLPAGFDPSIGPQLARVLNPLGELGRPRLNPHPPLDAALSNGASPSGSKGFPPMFLFPLHTRGVFRFRADFVTDPYANISFFAPGKVHIPFHLSLRFKEQLAVCNDTREDGVWRAERPRDVTLPRDGAEIEITLTPTTAIVRLDGAEIFSFGARQPWRRRGLKGLDQITFVEVQGGVRSPELAPAPPGPALGLDSRLLLTCNRPAAGHAIHTDPGGRSLALTASPMAGLQAHLPGRVWRDVPEGTALTLTLTGPDGAAVGPPLTLDRAEMARHIARILDRDPRPGDSAVDLKIVEHIRHGGLKSHLSPKHLTRARGLADSYGLGDYLDQVRDTDDSTAPDTEAPAEAQPEVAAPLPVAADPILDEIDTILAQIARSQHMDPAPDPLELLRGLSVSPPARRGVFLGLSELFACEGYDMIGLTKLAREMGMVPMNCGDDVWSQSASLPFVICEGRVDTAIELIWHLAEPTDGWVQTPAVAWALRHALTDAAVHDDQREAIIYAFIKFGYNRAYNYWERAHCAALTRAAALLLCRHGRDDYLADDITAFCIEVYGLSRRFWEDVTDLLAPGQSLHPRVTRARDAFEALYTADQTTAAGRKTIDTALRRLETAKCADAPRVRRELLGPASVADLPDTPLSLDALMDGTAPPAEAALRHMAYPGLPEAAPDVSDLVARSLPDFYDWVKRAPHFERQRHAAELAAAILTAPDGPLPTQTLDDLRATLTQLAGARSEFLGIGLALRLLALRPQATAPLCDWVLDHIDAIAADDLSWLRRAPAVLKGLAALRDHPGPHAEALVRAVDAGASPLPAPAPIAELPDGAAVYDTIVCVFSCQAYLETRIPALRSGWLSQLKALGIPYVIVVGDGDGRQEGDVLYLDAPDDYEGLPQKTLAAVTWVHDHTGFGHMVKIDDDCSMNAPLFFGSLSYQKFDYYGRMLTRGMGQMDRVWHQSKSSSDRGQLELDQSPEPSVYADGGSAYVLSRRAMGAALKAAASPAGQQLIRVSFMEDKMLGDLLALRGIRVAEEDYRVSIRRRSHSGARPVAAWLNSFFPSQTAPLQLIHLDSADDQAEAHSRMSAPGLWPKKIWPSFLPPALGYQTNTLELVSHERQIEGARSAEVALVACMRNEMFMLPHFLAHYRALGVTSFLIADNGSDDGTLEFLAEEPDVTLFSVDTDYNQSRYGVAWQQAMLAAFRQDRWSIVADADELLVWQRRQTQTLPELLATPDFAGAEAARIFMLDMYPQGPLEDATFASGDPFAEAGYCDAVPFLTDAPARGPYSDQPFWTSTLRHRLITGSRPNLFVAQKLALLRYRPWMRLSAGLHFVGDVKVAPRELIFAHFKYNADFRRKAATEVARKQHFNDAEEYRKYLALASEGRSIVHDPDLSVPWQESPFVAQRLD